MVGITLSPEQIRAAPPDVRHWLQQQIAALLSPLPVQPPHPGPQLVACSRQELRRVLTHIQTCCRSSACSSNWGGKPPACRCKACAPCA